MKVSVFGQIELVSRLPNMAEPNDHLISIGNPSWPLVRRKDDASIPHLFKCCYKEILRLEFFDVAKKNEIKWCERRRIPRLSDAKRVIKFYRDTKERASGYTIHCWAGVSRSTAVALAILFLESGSEDFSVETLLQIRPQAIPHKGLVGHFDRLMGSHFLDHPKLRQIARHRAIRRQLFGNANSPGFPQRRF